MYVILQMNECSFSSNADNASVKIHLWQYPVLELVPQFSSSKDCTSVFPPEACSTGFIMKCCSFSQSHYSRRDSVSVWRPGKAGVGYTDTVLWSAFAGEDSRNSSKLVFRGFVKLFETTHTVQCLKLPEGHRARFSPPLIRVTGFDC